MTVHLLLDLHPLLTDHQQVKRQAALLRRFLMFVMLCIYTLLHGKTLIAQTTVSWHGDTTVECFRIEEFVTLLLKSGSAYGLVITLS